MTSWETTKQASSSSYLDYLSEDSSPERQIRRPRSRESDENEGSNVHRTAWNSAAPALKEDAPKKLSMPKAPPRAPQGAANSIQSSKALVDKIRAKDKASHKPVAADDDRRSDLEAKDEDEDEDYIKNPRIPVPRREEETSLKEEADNDPDDDDEMNELNEEVKQSGFLSHRAKKQLAQGGRGEDEDEENDEKVCADAAGDKAYGSVPRSEYDANARDESFDHNDLEVLDTDKGEKILSVFSGGSFEVSEQRVARDNFFNHKGVINKDGQETIGRTKKVGQPFSIVAHEHGFMPVTSRSAYKGRATRTGTKPSARTGAADDGEFFETDKVFCTILRDRFTSKMYPEYQLILDSTQKPLLLAKKMKRNKTSNYHIFDTSRGRVALKGGAEFDKKSGNYLGKLRASNMNGTQYVLYGNQNSSSTVGSVNNYLPADATFNEADVRRELGSISYERMNLLSQFTSGSQPRKLSVVVPPLDADSVPVANTYLQVDAAKYSLQRCLKDPVEAAARECYLLENKAPTYENGNYRLNFSGRVSLPSVKNFQLVSPDDTSDILCQFGKVGDDTFHLDFKRPITAFQAFAFALSQFNL